MYKSEGASPASASTAASETCKSEGASPASASEPLVQRGWTPQSSDTWRSKVGRLLSIPCYPCVLPFITLNHDHTTVENARKWRLYFGLFGAVGGGLAHLALWWRSREEPAAWSAVLGHAGLFFSWDHTMFWATLVAHKLIGIIGQSRRTGRLAEGRLHGPRVLVVGNGPSALEGDAHGDLIDEFDEVVRFNNFQCKAAGMERWVGRKTTVHFSDGVLFPTYTEYHAEGADVVLSLFADRLMVAGSYLLMRACCDLQWGMTMDFYADRNLSWISKERIESLKRKLGLTGFKHPTSGMLAIDYFVEKAGVDLPVCIHGFDFFQGPKIHYYNDHEPLYERINNNIGVNMHSPHKEKIYVEKLVAEGKVKFLRDLRKDQ